jgi:hypothetical protein
MSDDAANEPELELIYIAGKLDEAQRIEALLTQHDIEYDVRVEQYRAGFIFVSVRAGAFFYVLPDAAARSREILTRLGYRVQEPLL